MTFAPVVDSFSQILLDSAARATLLLVLACVATSLMRRSSAALRHRVWSLTMSGLLLLPALSWLLPVWQLPVLPRDAQVARPEQVIAQHRVAPEEAIPLVETAPAESVIPVTKSVAQPFPALRPPSVAPVAAAPELSAAIPSWPVAVMIVWSFGAGLCFLGLMFGLWQARRLSSGSRSLGDEPWRQLMDHLRQRLGLVRRVELREFEQPIVPLTWGLFRPMVVLPQQARTWAEGMRRAVLLHELAHVQRGDVAHQLLGRVACALFWYHPLAWFGLRQLRQEREHACDDAVVQSGELASDYAEQLLEVARLYHRPGGLSLAVEMTRGGSLEQRLRALFDAARSHQPLSRKMAWSLLAVALLFLGTAAVIQPVPTSSEVVAAEQEQEQEAEQAADGAPEAVVTSYAQGRLVLEAGRWEHEVQVKDARGKPVVGAKLVNLGLGTARGSGGYWDKDWPKEFVTDEEGYADIVIPDASPIKEMGELGIVGFYFTVKHPQHPPRRGGLRNLDSDEVITLEDSLQLTIRARRDGDEKPLVADVFVAASGGNNAPPELQRDAWVVDGLNPDDPDAGRFLRVVHAPEGQSAWFSDLIDLKELFPGRGSEELDVTLHPGVRVAGVLADDVPRPIIAGRVCADITDGKEPRDWHWSDTAEIGADGEFVLESLPRNTNLQLVAFCDGWISKSPTKDDLQEYAEAYELKFEQGLGGSMVILQFFRLEGEVIEPEIVMTPTGQCEVTIVDAASKPLPDVSITFHPNRTMPGIGSTFVSSGRSTLTMLQRNVTWEMSWNEMVQENELRHGGRTDAEGRVVISNLPVGFQGARVALEGYEIAPDSKTDPQEWRADTTNATIQAKEVNNLKVTLRRKPDRKAVKVGAALTPAIPRQPGFQTRGKMLIRVVDEEGRAIENTNVYVNVANDIKGFPWNTNYTTDKNGESTIDLPQTFLMLRIWARRAGYAPMHANWEPERQFDGHLLPDEYEFQLARGTTIGGKVTDTQGRPIRQVLVEVMYHDPRAGKSPPPRLMNDLYLAEGDPDNHVNPPRATDENGRWLLDNVPAGNDVPVCLKLTHPEYVGDEEWGGLQKTQRVDWKQLRDQTAVIVLREGNGDLRSAERQGPESLAEEERGQFAESTAGRSLSELPAEFIRGENYVIVPFLKTELQDWLLGSDGQPRENHNVYVLIDGNSLYTADGRLNHEALDWNLLAAQLKPYSDRRQGLVTFHVFHFSVNAGDGARDVVLFALEGFGLRRAGFFKSYVTNSHRGAGSFWDFINPTTLEMSSREVGPERPVGDELVQVYPVQTFLSCLNSENADCVVRIVPRLTDDTGNELPPEIRKAIVRHVAALKLPQRRKVLFTVNYEPAAERTVEWFTGSGKDELARELQFEQGMTTSAKYGSNSK